MRKCWVYIEGVPYEKGTEPHREGNCGPTIMRDLPDVISPIDGTVIHGRAGLREHCLKHDVVPTADLKGLPIRQRYTADDTRGDIIKAMHEKGILG